MIVIHTSPPFSTSSSSRIQITSRRDFLLSSSSPQPQLRFDTPAYDSAEDNSQDLFRRRPVDVINDLSRSNISYSNSDLEGLKQRCQQEITASVFPAPLLSTTLHPLFSQSRSDGKESVLRDLLLPSTPQPIFSCGVQVASLNSFPMDSPRNYPLSDLLANTDPSVASAPLAPLSELFDDLHELGSVEMRVRPHVTSS
jgi:hypothetical protein